MYSVASSVVWSVVGTGTSNVGPLFLPKIPLPLLNLYPSLHTGNRRTSDTTHRSIPGRITSNRYLVPTTLHDPSAVRT